MSLRPPFACPVSAARRILGVNKTRQGYARERILKPAGYLFPGAEK